METKTGNMAELDGLIAAHLEAEKAFETATEAWTDVRNMTGPKDTLTAADDAFKAILAFRPADLATARAKALHVRHWYDKRGVMLEQDQVAALIDGTDPLLQTAQGLLKAGQPISDALQTLEIALRISNVFVADGERVKRDDGETYTLMHPDDWQQLDFLMTHILVLLRTANDEWNAGYNETFGQVKTG